MQMQSDETVFKFEERVVLELRELYRRYGYSCYKMSKFEEYDLYSKNKDFLVSDSVITFTDTNGKLMALKPDVTLSIVKNSGTAPGCVQRLYYDENVYRISEQTNSFREITQTGLECIGDVELFHCCEVLSLAVQSLQAISQTSVLNVSHLGVISKALEGLELGEDFVPLLKCVEDKNPGGVEAICKAHQVPEDQAALLCALPRTYGSAAEVLPQMAALGADAEALEELRTVTEAVGDAQGVKVVVDFSVLNNMKFYNGLVFRGYVKDIPSRVLSGGQYDRLMRKLHKDNRAIGFAVYLDLLERLEKTREVDVDVLLLFGEQDDPAAVLNRVRQITGEGKSVSAQQVIPEKLTYGTLEVLGKEEA